jgi:hypothetical protein
MDRESVRLEARGGRNSGSTIPYRALWRGPTVLKNRTTITGAWYSFQ